MDFREFSEKAEEIKDTAGNEQIDLVSKIFEEAGDDLEVSTRFVRGDIFPSWDDTKTSMGPSLIYSAISDFTGVSEDEIEEIVSQTGDAGTACEKIWNNKEQTSLGVVDDTITLTDAYEKFVDIAETSGSGSNKEKIKTFSSLISGTSPIEAKYLVRLVLDMRIGVGEGTVRDGISKAFSVDSDKVERAFMVSNDYGKVARVAKEEGNEGLDEIKMEVGKPVKPMLAKSMESVDEIEEIGETVGCETKYDGARLQIHKKKDEVKLFTRNLIEESSSLPDIVEEVKEKVSSDEVILDSEVVSYADGEPLDFNEMQKRLNRKYDVEEKSEEINLEIKVFDIIYLEGEVLIDKTLEERRNILSEVYPQPVNNKKIETKDDLKKLRAKAVREGNEGVMLKDMSSEYTPNNRGKRWIKAKPDLETLDCVVVKGEWGKGNREGTIGSYTIAIRDGDELKPIGKVGTGITDEELEDLTEKFEELIISEKGVSIEFKPEVVVEVGYEEIQESPKYSSGYALRFPRLESIREDKEVDDADTIERVEDIRR
jgi:DNA ligase-1